jgi:RNA polymerase sigma-70 factor (ECF subfamily)
MNMLTDRSRTRDDAPEAPAASDEQLLLRYRDDLDGAAFEELVRRYERELYNYLRRLLGDCQLAEDAFQATFLQVHLKCGQYDQQRPLRPWLYAIATHAAIDVQRRGRRHRLASLDDDRHDGAEAAGLGRLIEHPAPNPHAALEGLERGAWFRKAVAALPEALRAAVTLIFYQGLKYREAADRLEIPVGTVKSRTHAALVKLREAWTRAHEPHER